MLPVASWSMRPPRLRSLVPPIVVLCALVSAATAGAGLLRGAAPARTASNSATFQDSTGEDPQAPDITAITVSNTDAGLISFRITIRNRPQLGQDMLVDVFVNTDDNQSTGSPDLAGTDYVMELAQGEVNLFKWDGSNFSRRFG